MRRAWVKSLLVFPLVLAGCKGFWDALPSSSSGGSTTASSGDFYVLNGETQQVAGYSINSGTLTALTGSPLNLGVTPLSIAIAPGAGFLYIGTQNGIYLCTIASNGQLTIANNSQPISTDKATSMTISPNGDWLIDVQTGAPFVYAIAINSTNGTLASTSEQDQTVALPSGATSVQQVAISPDGSYVFAAMDTEGTAAIPFTSANANPFGAVQTIPLHNSAGASLSVAVDPIQSGQTTPRLLYIGETAAVSSSNSGGLRAIEFSSLGGTIKEIADSPFATSGLAPSSILPISTGNDVYVANKQVNGSNTGVIAGFSVASNSTTVTLTALGSTFTAGTNPVALAEDSTGTFVLAVDVGGSPDLKGFTFDSTNAGYLDGVISASTGTDPVQAGAIAAVP